jgi:hypothetical protein
LRSELLDAETKWDEAKIQVQINKITKQLKASEDEKKGPKLSYSRAAIKLWEDYQQTVFYLAEESTSETMESIKRMTVLDRMKFQQMINKRNKDRLAHINSKKGGKKV